MTLDDFYVLTLEMKRTALHLRPRDRIPPSIPEAITRGEHAPEQPFVFKVSSGTSNTDLVGCEIPAIRIVSDRFTTVCMENGITGWSTYPVEVIGKGGANLPGFQGLVVTGRCGPVDKKRAQRKRVPALYDPDTKRWGWFGVFFDLSTWDDSHLFCPQSINGERCAILFCTDAAKRILEASRMKNARFIRLSDYEWMA